MSEWLILSDHTTDQSPPPPQGRGLIPRGELLIELDHVSPEPAVLLDIRADQGWPRVFSVFHDPRVGVVVLHRQGAALMRHVLPGPLPQAAGVVQIRFDWDGPARRWGLTYRVIGTGQVAQAQGANPLPVVADDLAALARGDLGGHRDGAVLWFGVSDRADLALPARWIGAAVAVETPRGYVPAGQLQCGDLVLTADSGAVPVLGVQGFALPGRGSFAPVLLRAPFFGQRRDILVAPDQPVWLSGPEVEYLFGDDEVLVPARHLVDGRVAMAEHRRATVQAVAIDLGAPELIECDGCRLCSAAPAQAELPRRLLDYFEALPMTALLGGRQRAGVA